MAGIWDIWINKETGAALNTFSIITTKANPLMARIHNSKERMPVILKREGERRWLGSVAEMKDINAMQTAYDEREMEAFPVSRLISHKGMNTNTPDVIAPYHYHELALQL